MKVAFLAVVLWLAASSTAWAQAGARPPGDVLCDDDRLICRESCSMELGTRSHNREKVLSCMSRCEQSHTVCLQRQIAKRKASPRSSESTQEPKPAVKEEFFSGAPTRFSQEEPVPEAETETVAPVRRSVTRTGQLEAAPDHSPTAYPDREGFVSWGGPTREERAQAAAPQEAAADEAPEAAAAGDEGAEAQEPPAGPIKRSRPANELGY